MKMKNKKVKDYSEKNFTKINLIRINFNQSSIKFLLNKNTFMLS